MPDKSHTTYRPSIIASPPPAEKAIPYYELCATSNFSFLQGASHPEELVTHAYSLGYRGLALTDTHTLAGAVRGHRVAKELGFSYNIGSRVALSFQPTVTQRSEGSSKKFSLLLYPTDRASYGRLCSLLTKGNLRTTKGSCELCLEDFFAFQNGLVAILVPPLTTDTHDNYWQVQFFEFASLLKKNSWDNSSLSIGITRNYLYRNSHSVTSALEIARCLAIAPVIIGNVHYHTPERRPLQDVLTCIKHTATIRESALLLSQNAERYLKPLHEVAHLYRDLPAALSRTLDIAERIKGFSLEQLKYEYPNEIFPGNRSATEYLTELIWQKAAERYPHGIPDKVSSLIKEEFALIHELKYEKYFLTCYDIVHFARSRGILCQGRGAAANSAICYCLGITSVDPQTIDVLFARFINRERDEPPDIDIDFEHERREEVIQYIYDKYGRHRAGLTAAVITYRARSAVRDVGKVLGLSLEAVDKLAKAIHRWSGNTIPLDIIREIGLNPESPGVKNTLLLSQQLQGFPRHLSQHVGGFIISQYPLIETVPVLNTAMESRTIIEWDKDDIETLGMLKIDILALGMLTCIRKALDYINQKNSAAPRISSPLALHTIPAEDPAVYEMIQKADTIGVFQIESRAQMSMLPRLKPACFYDLVIEVAIVRPGPIHGNMVHPYLKRRAGIEPVFFPDERVEKILGRTLGVPIFQEQALRLAIVLASFTPEEAEKLRRAMASWKRDKQAIQRFKERIMEGMQQSGYSEEFADNYMNQIKGFSEYGFPESHAASFALLVYASAWIKKHYPAEFAAALLNSQPMGFYAPSQLISDAVAHHVQVYPIDINYSGWDTISLDDKNAIRLGLRLVKGLSQEQARILIHIVAREGPLTSLHSLWFAAATSLKKETLTALARADAFQSLNLSPRQALWEIQGLIQPPAPLDGMLPYSGEAAPLPRLSLQQSMFEDYRMTGFSLKAHPISFVRSYLNSRGVLTARGVRSVHKKNASISVAGIGIFRQRPGTAKGVVFITLEDETGIVNLIIRPAVFEKNERIILSCSAFLASGNLERVGEVIYLSVFHIESLDARVLETGNSPLPLRSYSY